MIYFKGDTHGGYRDIIKFCNRQHLLRTDVIIILGDVGYNYYGGERDEEAKRHLSHVKPTILCIHGNHEIRRPVKFQTIVLTIVTPRFLRGVYRNI